MASPPRFHFRCALQPTVAILLAAASLHCSDNNQPSTASSIEMAGGNEQIGIVSEELASPLVVLVTDKNGDPVEGVAVQWDAQGAGSVSPETVETGPDGLASSTRVLGPTPGEQSTTASVNDLDGSPVTFVVTASPIIPPCTLSPNDSAKAALQFVGFFESPSPFKWWSVNEADVAAHTHTHSTDLQRDCSGSARLEIRKSDPLEAGSYRSELKVLHDSANGGVPVTPGQSVVGNLGHEMWMGWSIYIPSDWVFETGYAPETVAQVKPGGGRAPTWEIQIDRGDFMVYSRTGDASSCCTQTVAGTQPITQGAWHDFVLHVLWKGDSTGILEMWMNGAKFVDRHNVPTAFGDWDGMGITYLKLGVYKWSWKSYPSLVTTRVLYLDAVRITDGAHGSYDVVAPR